MKMSRIVGIISATIIAGGLLSACGDSAPQSPPPPTAKETTKPVAQTAPAKKVAWPGKSNAVKVASNLTAANYMIVYDGSGSMRDAACGGSKNSKHAEGLDATKTFVTAIPDTANVGLYVFDNRGKGIKVPLGTGNKQKVIAALDNVRTGDGTPLGTATITSYKALTAQAQSQLGYGRYSLVIVTDGAASPHSEANFLPKAINYVTSKSPIEIHTIGFCLGTQHVLNQPGKTFYASAQSKADLLAGLKGVLAEAENVSSADFK